MPVAWKRTANDGLLLDGKPIQEGFKVHEFYCRQRDSALSSVVSKQSLLVESWLIFTKRESFSSSSGEKGTGDIDTEANTTSLI